MGERNVQISSTFLGREGHGIPTFSLTCTSPGSGQGFGNWDLRYYGVGVLMRVLEVVGVESWEKLAGSYCRVRGDRNKLTAIGHITEDKWYDVEAEGPLDPPADAGTQETKG